MKKIKKLALEAIATFILAIIVAAIAGVSAEIVIEVAALFTVIWMSRYIPYEHPYGYKGDWYGYKPGMIK